MLDHISINFVLLATLLALATWFDIRQSRIPNSIVCLVLVLGFGTQASVSGWTGVVSAGYGFAVALVLLLPFYALRALGAGDVKLIASVGAFVGAKSILGTIVAIMLCGGVFALAVVATQRLKASTTAGPVDMPLETRKTKFPFAASIACGTLGYLTLAGQIL